MKIYTADQLHDIQRATINSDAVTDADIIDRMAESVASEVVTRLKSNSRVAIFAGPGQCGAQALAAARMLVDQGVMPAVFLFNRGGSQLSPDCIEAKKLLLAKGADISFTEITSQFNLPPLSRADIIVDGLFGSELREPLSSGFRELVKYITDSEATIISIDIPSGLMSEWNPTTIHRNVIHATVTLAPQFPHLAFLIQDNADIVGQWRTVDMGFSPQAIRNTPAPYYFIQRADIRRILRPRPEFCSKADFGSALIMAGSYGMMGAAIMAARGALRAGVGRLSVYSPRCGFDPLQSAVPEAMFEAANSDIVIEEMRPRAEYDAIGIGPGIGTRDETVNALENFLKLQDRPLVLDADALNCIARRQSILHTVPVLSILTPHAAEFDRIFGPQRTAEARLKKAIEVSAHHNILIVLKGRYTAIVRPDGRIYFNSSGSPAMATPGSGDVLTGVITALLAQGYKPEVAALAGVYIHGLAGEMAADDEGTYGVTASDIASRIGRAIQSI